MPEINASDFIEELRFDIREKDLIKAKLVLSKIGAVDDSVRKMALFELNRADDAIAIPLIVNLVADHRDLARAYPQTQGDPLRQIHVPSGYASFHALPGGQAGESCGAGGGGR